MAEEQDRSGQRDWGGDTAALGGYGSAGLYSRRRQMERTSGGSYQNLANAPTMGNVASSEPLVSGHTGPSGPSALAQGVAGNIYTAPPETPDWKSIGKGLGQATGAAGAIIGTYKGWQEREKKRADESAKAETEAETKAEAEAQPHRDAAQAAKDKYKQDQAARYATANARAAIKRPAMFALPPGPPVMPGRRDTSQDVTPVNAADFADPAPTRVGPIVVGTQRALPPAGGSSRATTRLSRSDEPQAGLVRQTTAGVPDFPGMRPPAGQEAGQDVEAMANSYEFGNAFYGQSAGRNATRAERNARKDSNQGQIYGFDWGNR